MINNHAITEDERMLCPKLTCSNLTGNKRSCLCNVCCEVLQKTIHERTMLLESLVEYIIEKKLNKLYSRQNKLSRNYLIVKMYIIQLLY